MKRILVILRVITLSFLLTFFYTGKLKAQKNRVYNVMDYGATGDGNHDDAASIQNAIDACFSAGGGQVFLPAGYVFMSGPFDLKSNIDFHIAGGTKLLANPEEKVYTQSAFRQNTGEGTIWIGGNNIQNLVLSGTGEINGNGISFMGPELEDSYELKGFTITDPRPHVLTIIGGKNIRIRDLTIGNSAYWTIHLVGCNDVAISDITLLNNLKVRNGDGIDLDHSKNVRITNCYIESGDDCICLKNRREYEAFGACENITVSNCTMTSRSCAIKIGSENMDRISQVVFNNCIIKASNRGVGIQNRDEGTVEDILFSNILIESRFFSDLWWGKAEPIYITAYRRAKINHKDANWRFPKGATEGRVGAVKNIFFNNIKCKSENGIYVSGESADKISGIYFDQVDIFIDKTTALPGGVYDRRPSNVEGLVKENTSAFYLNTASNIMIRNSSASWGKNIPSYYAHAIKSVKVNSLKISNFSGVSAFPARFKAIIEGH